MKPDTYVTYTSSRAGRPNTGLLEKMLAWPERRGHSDGDTDIGR